VGEGLQLPFSLREKGPGVEGCLNRPGLLP